MSPLARKEGPDEAESGRMTDRRSTTRSYRRTVGYLPDQAGQKCILNISPISVYYAFSGSLQLQLRLPGLELELPGLELELELPELGTF